MLHTNFTITNLFLPSYSNHKLNIFHATTSTCNPFRWGLIDKKISGYLNETPLLSSVWYAHLKLIESLFIWKLAAIFFHFIPAYFLDTVTRLAGGRPILVRMHTNIWNSLELMIPFLYNEYLFDNRKTLAYASAMSPIDQSNFGFDCRTIVWAPYFNMIVKGVRRYLWKEHPRNMKAALTKQRL